MADQVQPAEKEPQLGIHQTDESETDAGVPVDRRAKRGKSEKIGSNGDHHDEGRKAKKNKPVDTALRAVRDPAKCGFWVKRRGRYCRQALLRDDLCGTHLKEKLAADATTAAAAVLSGKSDTAVGTTNIGPPVLTMISCSGNGWKEKASLVVQCRFSHRERAIYSLEKDKRLGCACKLVAQTKPRTGNTSTLLFTTSCPSQDVIAVLGKLPVPSLRSIILNSGRMFPVTSQCTGTAALVAILENQLKSTSNEECVHIQAIPAGVTTFLVNELAKVNNIYATERVKNREESRWMLTVVHIGSENYLYGLVPAKHDLRAHSALGPVEHSLAKKRASRAQLKLLELFESGLLTIDKSWCALDVGAAPGGWSQFLARRLKLVVAIDPGDLHAEVLELSNVVHLAQKVQDAKEGLLASKPEEGYDLVVCDMNMDSREGCRLVCELLPYLAQGAALVYTIKLVFRGRESEEKQISETIELLSPYFKDIETLWLYSNTQHERTIVARRRKS